jgi:hypothetical protein
VHRASTRFNFNTLCGTGVIGFEALNANIYTSAGKNDISLTVQMGDFDSYR